MSAARGLFLQGRPPFCDFLQVARLPSLLLVASVSQWPSASHHTSKKTFAKTQWRGVKENTMEKSQRKHSGERSNKTQWREVKENTVEKSQRIATNLPGLLLLVISSGLQPLSQSCKMSTNIINSENLHFNNIRGAYRDFHPITSIHPSTYSF